MTPFGSRFITRIRTGKPAYSYTPMRTADGREYWPVFEDIPAVQAASGPAPTPKPQAGGDHRVLYYRNPMGLPDTSSKPKRDAMGMEYLPVYADDGAKDDPPGTVKISPGRLQTLGV
ncbi:MAG: hypothetical protein WDN69_29660 [Aliidongia sp.]